MTKLVKRALVCYDGSKGSQKVLEFARNLARLDDQMVVDLLSVIRVQLPYEMYAGSLLIDQASLIDDYEQRAYEWLDEVKLEWGLPNPVHSHVVEGSPVEEILAFAKKNQTDLIVIGNRSLGPVKELLLGSVSHYVVQHAHCPVLVVK